VARLRRAGGIVVQAKHHKQPVFYPVRFSGRKISGKNIADFYCAV
jgi:hypothetical protein